MFYLFSTSACHLCDQANDILLELQAEVRAQGVDWVFNVVDIAEDDILFERYGVRIPVLWFEGAEQDLGWPFELVDARTYVHSKL